jgi:hypothetical protein
LELTDEVRAQTRGEIDRIEKEKKSDIELRAKAQFDSEQAALAAEEGADPKGPYFGAVDKAVSAGDFASAEEREAYELEYGITLAKDSPTSAFADPEKYIELGPRSRVLAKKFDQIFALANGLNGQKFVTSIADCSVSLEERAQRRLDVDEAVCEEVRKLKEKYSGMGWHTIRNIELNTEVRGFEYYRSDLQRKQKMRAIYESNKKAIAKQVVNY